MCIYKSNTGSLFCLRPKSISKRPLLLSLPQRDASRQSRVVSFISVSLTFHGLSEHVECVLCCLDASPCIRWALLSLLPLAPQVPPVLLSHSSPDHNYPDAPYLPGRLQLLVNVGYKRDSSPRRLTCTLMPIRHPTSATQSSVAATAAPRLCHSCLASRESHNS